MKALSIFIDESGDFGFNNNNPSYYITTFVFHNQLIDISNNITKLKDKLNYMESSIEYIHLGPIIRKESVFNSLTIDQRRKYAYKMLNFINSIPINHFSIVIDKKHLSNKIELSGKLSKEISTKIDKHINYFNDFDKIIVYYDYGQIELSSILNAIFSVHFSNVEFRKAEPQNYALLQVADFICTLELLKNKKSLTQLSKSEINFFYKPKELGKTFIKSIAKKEL